MERHGRLLICIVRGNTYTDEVTDLLDYWEAKLGPNLKGFKCQVREFVFNLTGSKSN